MKFKIVSKKTLIASSANSSFTNKCVLFKMTKNDEAKAKQDAKDMLVSNFECALCKKKHFSPNGLEANLPVQVNKIILKQLEQYEG